MLDEQTMQACWTLGGCTCDVGPVSQSAGAWSNTFAGGFDALVHVAVPLQDMIGFNLVAQPASSVLHSSSQVSIGVLVLLVSYCEGQREIGRPEGPGPGIFAPRPVLDVDSQGNEDVGIPEQAVLAVRRDLQIPRLRQ